MTRHIVAFLALLSGLAALNSPAHASMAEAMACDTSVTASTQDEAKSEQVLARTNAKPAKSDAASQQVERTALRPANLRLPVLMGIERAYE